MQHSRASVHHRIAAEAVAPPPNGSGRTPLQIADHNLRVTLEAIRRDGPLTRLELARRSGLTAPGITNILRRLGGDGLVTARQRDEAGNRQPSMEFALNPDGAFAAGVRLGPAGGEAVLIDLSGRVRSRVEFSTGDDCGASLAAAVRRLAGGTVPDGRMLGVGIGIEMPDGADVDALRAALDPLRVSVERDCVTAVLAERMLGVGAIDGGLVLIIIGEGVRAGFLLHGVPFGGVHGRAGSIGAMRTGADHVPLDSVASLGALRALLSPDERATLAAGRDLPLSPAVQGWIKTAAGHLLDAIVATAGFVAPGAILIGGDVPRNVIDALIAQVRIERGDTAIRPYQTPWISTIRPASFAGAGIALGAALLPLFDRLLPSPLTPG